MKGKRSNNKNKSKNKKVTVVHSYEDRPKHLSDPSKYPDPNEIVPAAKAPGLNLQKKLFPCGNGKCQHDIREHKAITTEVPRPGNNAGQCKICKCKKYQFSGKVEQFTAKVKKGVGMGVVADAALMKKKEVIDIKPGASAKIYEGFTKKKKKYSKEHRAHMSEGRNPQIQLVKQAEIRDMLKRGKTFHEISDITHAGNKMIIEVKKSLPKRWQLTLRKQRGGPVKKPKYKRRVMKPWMKRVGVK